MSSARYFNVSADIQNGEYTFRARGSKQIFDGYLRVYNIEKEEDKLLPDMIQGQKLNCEKVDSEQSFTQPPARYTEASLVKSLEDLGIGRPSTYAPIVATLTDRRYIRKEKSVTYRIGSYCNTNDDRVFQRDSRQQVYSGNGRKVR